MTKLSGRFVNLPKVSGEINEVQGMSGNLGTKVVIGEPESGGSGENGATFYPFVSEAGVISWTNDKGLTNPPSVNIKGKDGINGKDGYTPIKGVDYFDGVNGKDGKDGIDGADGYTPVKGKDYFTEADKAEMVSDVLAALPSAEGVGF